ncbi:MAG: nuclear transport factor 2 family protein [Vitreimonas sp.]
MLKAARINQLSDDASDWYARYLTALDSGDAEEFRAYIDEACVMQINDDLPLYGADVILSVVKRNWIVFERVEHEPLNIYGSDASFAVEMLCHFTRRGGARVTVPGCAFVDRGGDGRAMSLRMFLDLAPAIEKHGA